MTRGALLLTVALACAACGGPLELNPDGATIIDESGESLVGDLPVSVRGAPECGSELTAVIEVSYPLGNLERGETRTYVRDPDAVIPPVELEAPYDGRSSLSDDARYTGYGSGPYTIWIGSDADQYVYLVDGPRVEAWPRINELNC